MTAVNSPSDNRRLLSAGGLSLPYEANRVRFNGLRHSLGCLDNRATTRNPMEAFRESGEAQ